MQQPKKQSYAIEEYFAQEEKAEIRSEYYQGEIFAMTGGSINHNQIVLNLIRVFSSLPKPCRTFATDLRLRVEAHDLFTYPDVMVVCGKPEFYAGRTDTITNPVALLEVLSKTTEAYDRGKKFEFYRALPSLREYILIDQYRAHVDQFILKEGNWQLIDVAEVLRFDSVDFTCKVQEIYQDVDFDLS